MPSLFSVTSTLALAALHASAHVIMIEPHPYNLDTEPLYQTWPLSADLPFPCQGRFQHAEEITEVTAGTTQTVKFWGSAVHGGGSCQFSVGYGETPPKDPKDWHTIYSIIGGCPAEAEGNIPTDSKDPHGRENGPQCGNDKDKECARQFDIPIPKDMKNGPAVFAWTWFNKIGNREMYMVCAPIQVVGGKDDSSFVDGLPAIFRANIPGECTIGPSGNVIGFPEPGEFGKVYQEVGAGSEGSCEKGVTPEFKGGDAPEKPGSSAPAKPSSPSSAQPGSSAPAQPSPPSSGQPVAPPAESSAAVAPSAPIEPSAPIQPSAPVQPSVPAVPSGSSPVQPPAPTQPGAPAESGRPSWVDDRFQACPPGVESGHIHCFSETTWGLCNQGWAIVAPVADGTKCIDGAIA
ncbi:hypothetical protein F66182_9116 [Fusarium sp. NRRL 66182]|nr:hypothetical protein F66182_9116 [Fusarium sp. NRRL 66182]